jgi:hypothetical protein
MTSKSLIEGHRNKAAGQAEHRIHRKLQRMDQLILRNLEEGVIAEEHA